MIVGVLYDVSMVPINVTPKWAYALLIVCGILSQCNLKVGLLSRPTCKSINRGYTPSFEKTNERINEENLSFFYSLVYQEIGDHQIHRNRD